MARPLALALLCAVTACARPAATVLGRDLSRELPSSVGTEPEAPAATLVRFWTDGCPHCAETLPALEALRQEFPGLRALAVYHPKPPRAVELAEARNLARELGFEGAVAVDPSWERLLGWNPDAGGRAPTSYSLLLDRSSRVRWVHPGPRLHPSTDPAHAGAASAYEDLRHLLSGLAADLP